MPCEGFSTLGEGYVSHILHTLCVDNQRVKQCGEGLKVIGEKTFFRRKNHEKSGITEFSGKGILLTDAEKAKEGNGRRKTKKEIGPFLGMEEADRCYLKSCPDISAGNVLFSYTLLG